MLVYKSGIYHNITADELNDYKEKGYEEVIPDIDIPEELPAPQETTSKSEEKLTCPVCGKQYANETTLANHMKKEHPEFTEASEPPKEE